MIDVAKTVGSWVIGVWSSDPWSSSTGFNGVWMSENGGYREPLYRWFLAAVILGGHTAMWLAAFNRINATGLARPTIKKIEKSFVLAWFAILILVIWFERESLRIYFFQPNQTPAFHWLFQGYFVLCSLAFLAMLPGWLAARWGLREDAIKHHATEKSYWNVAEHRSESIYTSKLTQFCAKLPGNEIGKLELNCKQIPVHAPNAFQGMRIAHLSDLHLTGRMGREFYEFAIGLLMQQEPQLVILSGDLVDYASQLELLPSLLKPIHAPYGCYFVLGNHDRRLPSPQYLRQLMTDAGWIDLGTAAHTLETELGAIELVGNETPWFGSRHPHWPFEPASTSPKLKIAVSHSPDQFAWASQLGAHLLLAGHTHGGQVRLPWIGPIVAPSWHGSRFASGVFRKKRTMMHVSRGLSGVHPIRFRCLPEVSILELKMPEDSAASIASQA